MVRMRPKIGSTPTDLVSKWVVKRSVFLHRLRVVVPLASRGLCVMNGDEFGHGASDQLPFPWLFCSGDVVRAALKVSELA
jgi:hypothetical protein